MGNGLSRWLSVIVAVWGTTVGVLFWNAQVGRAVAPVDIHQTTASSVTVSEWAERMLGGYRPPAAQGAPTAQPDLYAGDDTCLVCHDDRSYSHTAHGRATYPGTLAATRGCESCHGAGLAHAESGGDVSLIVGLASAEAEVVGDTCTSCHNRGSQAMWVGSPHERRDVSCTTCHTVHATRSPEHLLSALTELDTCGGCHRDKLVKLDRSGHMPVREGKMQCSSCHNPHGSQNERLLKVGMTVNDACTSCHADKRGPFLWEHAPVRENCASCHDPHGSSNDRMLIAKLPMLCQRCHAHTRHPSTIYDNQVARTSNRLYARSCVTCHSNVHGSNHPSGATFLR